MHTIEHVLAIRNELGECPLWNIHEKKLYWVDIDKHTIFNLDPISGIMAFYDVGLPVGSFAFRSQGGLVLATRDGFAFWEPGDNDLHFIGDPEPGKQGARFNDGSVDRAGHFWAGTMTEYDVSSSLYRLDGDQTIHQMEVGITIANGMGWSPDNRVFYFTDTFRKTIYAYDFDFQAGTISNRRIFAALTDETGLPDGLTVDSEGFVWSVRCGGGCVVRYDPTGKVERVITLPISHPTSCTFGGKELNELYITSSKSLVPEAVRPDQPLAGDLFRLRLDIKGLPVSEFLG